MNPQDTQVGQSTTTPATTSPIPDAPVVETPIVSDIQLDLSDLDFDAAPNKEVLVPVVQDIPVVVPVVDSLSLSSDAPPLDIQFPFIDGQQSGSDAVDSTLVNEDISQPEIQTFSETISSSLDTSVSEVQDSSLHDTVASVSDDISVVSLPQDPVVQDVSVVDAPVQDAWLAQEDVLAGHSLARDVQLIQNIQGSDVVQDVPVVQDVIESTETADSSLSVSLPVEEVVPSPISQVSSSSVDLDSLLDTPTPVVQEVVSQDPVSQEIVTPSSPVFSFPPIPSVISSPVSLPVSVPITSPVSGVHHRSSKLSLLLVALVVILGGFVLKVMYPLQFTSLLAFVGLAEKEQITGMKDDTPSLEDSLAQTGMFDDMSGVSEDTSMTSFVSSGNQINSGEDTSLSLTLTGQTHASAPDSNSGFDAFKELDEGISTGVDTKSIRESLTFYSNEGKKFLVLAKKNQDKMMMKYSLALFKKSSALLDTLANGDQIVTTGINQQLDQLSGYLYQLNDLSHVSSSDVIVSQEESKNLSGSFSEQEQVFSGSEETFSGSNKIFSTGTSNFATGNR